jgi:hypothetical protein
MTCGIKLANLSIFGRFFETFARDAECAFHSLDSSAKHDNGKRKL